MDNIKRTIIPFSSIPLALLPLALLLMVSCVTINVYFPAAAAQQAADEIVNEVLKQGKNLQQKKSNDKGMQPDSSFYQVNQKPIILVRLLNFIIPTVQAGANMSIDTPKIRSLRNQLKQLHRQLVPYFSKGNVGYADNGLIKIRSSKGLNIKQKSTMKKLVNGENATLSNLYAEIAKANGHPEWKNDIQKTFAKTWVNQMQGGWMYYRGGKWNKK